MRRARRLGSLLAVGGVLATMTLIGTGSASSTPAVPALPNAAAVTTAASTSITKSRSVERDQTDGTTTTVLDKRTVSVTVAQTTGLKSLQQIQVTWTGAMPTGGITADPNSDFAMNHEHSFVLLECRGVDSASVPAAQQLSQKTCWTQFADERFTLTGDGVNFPAWRSDMYAAPAQRDAIVNAPASANNPVCTSSLFGSATQYWVPFIGADGKTYGGGPAGCAGQPPEASPANLSSLALPSNETFGVTAPNGTGSASFDVFTAEDHATLGCSQTVPCSLVAIPIEGISCDSTGALSQGQAVPTAAELPDAQAACETNGDWQVGQLLPVGRGGEPAVDGRLWWSASNWRNRITFPLSFAAPDNACSLTSSLSPLLVYGSELLSQATTQWGPYFCATRSLFDLQHVATAEPQARNLLATNNIEAAFTSDLPDGGYPQPTVSAPVAVTGFGIATAIVDKNGRPVAGIRLDARLVAKLLTESYPDQTFVRDPYPAKADGTPTLSKNPLNMSQDPEFQALNPNVPLTGLDTASTLLALNSDSDVMYALTAWIAADPEASAFIAGQPDPWGMRVNANYQGFSLPTDHWPVLDTFVPVAEYQPGKIDCLIGDNTPFLPLVASPTSALFSIGQDMQYGISQAQTICVLPSPIPGSLDGAKMVAQGREPPGKQFMLGVVSLGDAAREGLNLASLQSQATADPSDPFTSAAGRTFVAPTTASLKAAASMFVESDSGTTKSWSVDYNSLRTAVGGATAYPGTLPVYASIPTRGLPATDATDYATMLRYMAGPGQVQGTAQGQLPPGYLPMTSANGLAGMAAYTEQAANLVAAQANSPATGGHAGSAGNPASVTSTSATHATTGVTGGGESTASTGGGGGAGAAVNSAAPKAVPSSPTSQPPTQPSTIAAKPAAQSTPLFHSGLGAAILPAALVVIGACALGLLGLHLYRRFG